MRRPATLAVAKSLLLLLLLSEVLSVRVGNSNAPALAVQQSFQLPGAGPKTPKNRNLKGRVGIDGYADGFELARGSFLPATGRAQSATFRGLPRRKVANLAAIR
jgi:hypothetical protein